MRYCETCKKDINNNTKFSQIKSSAAYTEKEVISRINNNLTDKPYTYINPYFEQVDNIIKRAIDECTQHFHRYIYIKVNLSCNTWQYKLFYINQ